MSEPKRKLCFVISPIGNAGSDFRRHADMTLNCVIRPEIDKRPEFDVRRGDEVADPGMIGDQMIADILEAELCIADLSFLNPNVFYEIGLRHMTGKPIIHMAAIGTEIPFDNVGHRAILFDPFEWNSQVAARAELDRAISAVLAPGYAGSNPVTQARGVQKLLNSTDDRDRIIAELIGRIDHIEAEQVRLRSLPGGAAASTIMRRHTKDGTLSLRRLSSGDFLVRLAQRDGHVKIVYRGPDLTLARRLYHEGEKPPEQTSLSVVEEPGA